MAYERFDVETIFPEKRKLFSPYIEIPDGAFVPDTWTTALQRGLDNADLSGTGLEVGVGSGVNPIYLLSGDNDIEFVFGSDINGKVLDQSHTNVHAALGQNGKPQRYVNFYKPFSLVEGIQHYRFDFIYACIPQVRLPENMRIDDEDNASHYYDPQELLPDEGNQVRGQIADLDLYGLGLNYALLDDIHRKNLLLPDGIVLLNLSGRPSKDRLAELFLATGFTPGVVHEELVSQHPETSLEKLVVMERAGLDFEFFSDDDAHHKITAEVAEDRRYNGDPVFHKIYVFSGKRTDDNS